MAMTYFELLHPRVQAELLARAEADPATCHYAYGAVRYTAMNPAPNFCVKRRGHSGNHADAELLAHERKLTRQRVSAWRARND